MNERTFRRYYAEVVPFTTLNQYVIEQGVSSQRERIVGVDASFLPKSGKQTEGLGQFYNGCQGKSERGLEWSVLSLIDLEQNTAYTLNATQTLPTHSPPGQESRTQQYLAQVQQNRQAIPDDVQYLVADGYYSKKSWLDGIRALQLHAIGKLRRDANLKYFYTGPQKPRGRKRLYGGKVDFPLIDSPPEHVAGFKRVQSLKQDHVELYRAWLYSTTFQRALQVVYVLRVTPTGSAYTLLFCTDESLSALDIYRYYKARFQIEFIFRDSKQFLGLTHCQARDSHKLNFHVNSVLLTLNLLKVHHYQQQTPDSSQPFSVSNYKRRAFNHYLLNTFFSKSGLNQTSEKYQTQYLECLDIGQIKA